MKMNINDPCRQQRTALTSAITFRVDRREETLAVPTGCIDPVIEERGPTEDFGRCLVIGCLAKGAVLFVSKEVGGLEVADWCFFGADAARFVDEGVVAVATPADCLHLEGAAVVAAIRIAKLPGRTFCSHTKSCRASFSDPLA
jgi:hypothetical protein